MKKVTDLEKLKVLKIDLIELNDANDKLSVIEQNIEESQQVINNPKQYVLENAKPTDNKEELENEFKEQIEEKCEVDGIWKILKETFFVRWWKVVSFIVLFILFVLVAEIITRNIFKVSPNLTSDELYEQGGKEVVLYGLLAIIVAINVIPTIFRLIVRAIKVNKLRKMKYSKKQLMQLKKAEELDIKNNEYNQEIINKEKGAFEEKENQSLIELKENLEKSKKENEKLKSKIEKLTDKIEKNDCVGSQEKVLEIVEMLIYFIETKRADSIKEALHEYDNIRYNEAQLVIEQQKLALQQKKMEDEKNDRELQMDRERRHQLEVEVKMDEEAKDRARIEKGINMIGYDVYNSTRK